jgi:glycosyltransferase involved in cell wall biosynthesis
MIADSGWAIGHLAQAIVKRLPQFEWRYMEIHPKGLERGEVDLAPIREAVEWADVIDFQYWRVASQLVEMIPEIKNKITVVTHQNDKDLFSADWSWCSGIIARTRYAFGKLYDKYSDKVKLVTIGIDIESFPYHGQDPATPMVGYVGRIVPWKGLKEIARACYELKYPLLVLGKMDKPTYMAEIPMEHQNNMDFSYFNCEDHERLEAYKQMTIYVGNSIAGRESGTMPYMEAMAVGVPVVTTPSGIAADIGKDRDNALIVPFEDYDLLKKAIQDLMTNAELRNELRDSAWKTVSRQNWDRMAYEYAKVYYSLAWGDIKQVSVIIPSTYSRLENVQKIVKAIDEQTYQNCEILVVWDEKEQIPQPIQSERPIRQFWASGGVYNLAQARNIGIINATGEYLLFCDSRMCPEREAVETFVNETKDSEKVWFFGEKGGNKTTFVENFSFIKRQDIINAGMFNERVQEYGGMSQELRARFNKQGFTLQYLPEAKATQLHKTSLSPERRMSIVRSKNLLYFLNLN